MGLVFEISNEEPIAVAGGLWISSPLSDDIDGDSRPVAKP